MSDERYTLWNCLDDAADEFRERIEDETEPGEDYENAWPHGPDYDGTLHEVADGHVPIYTYDLMQMGAEHLDLACDEPELGPAFDGTPTPSNIIAANIYERLTAHLYEVWANDFEGETKAKVACHVGPKPEAVSA